MLKRIHISGYRSLLDLSCDLTEMTVISGENGVGKSNFYKALLLVKALAEGNFAQALANEGGMVSALWAGERKRHETKTISIRVEHSDFTYYAKIGLIPSSPTDPSFFKTDPDIKDEKVSIQLKNSQRTVAKRSGNQLMLSENTQGMEHFEFSLLSNESILSQVKDPSRYPFLCLVRSTILEWRFFHEFDTSQHSILRHPQVSYYSPFLNDDGSNLLGALQSIVESGNEYRLSEFFTRAFPDLQFSIEAEQNYFRLEVFRHDLSRPLTAIELSDGTLRFLCLLAALLSPHQPHLLVFNEPEMSLNSRIYPVLAQLLSESQAQLLVVSHDQKLAGHLSQAGASSIQLMLQSGATIHTEHAGSHKVWSFD
ncbi:AAA family ATPase [Rubritalea tangerina]|uniref:AAA family ATPase n=1 Tax=Rubritalea tangerina TaxID=430798 RepID=A0ABW4ZAT5_9BACT